MAIARKGGRLAVLALDGRRGERLDQVEAARVRDLTDAGHHLRVVDRVVEVIAANAGVVGDEPDVEEEALAGLLLGSGRAVEAHELEPLDLDLHLTHRRTSSRARAAASACTCSRTSWTRKIAAPRS